MSLSGERPFQMGQTCLSNIIQHLFGVVGRFLSFQTHPTAIKHVAVKWSDTDSVMLRSCFDRANKKLDDVRW